jgi:hypothetical protein
MILERAIRAMFAAWLISLAIPAQTQSRAVSTETSVADGTGNPKNGSPALTGERRPLYRLRKSTLFKFDSLSRRNLTRS